MTEQETLIRARNLVIQSKLWGLVCERAIKSGAWDNGRIVQNAIAELMKRPVEVEG